MVVGVALIFLPGPAFLVLPVGAGLLADEWLVLAKLLDFAEVKTRRWIVAARRLWQRMSVLWRGALILLGTLATASAGYVVFRITGLG